MDTTTHDDGIYEYKLKFRHANPGGTEKQRRCRGREPVVETGKAASRVGRGGGVSGARRRDRAVGRGGGTISRENPIAGFLTAGEVGPCSPAVMASRPSYCYRRRTPNMLAGDSLLITGETGWRAPGLWWAACPWGGATFTAGEDRPYSPVIWPVTTSDSRPCSPGVLRGWVDHWAGILTPSVSGHVRQG